MLCEMIVCVLPGVEGVQVDDARHAGPVVATASHQGQCTASPQVDAAFSDGTLCSGVFRGEKYASYTIIDTTSLTRSCPHQVGHRSACGPARDVADTNLEGPYNGPRPTVCHLMIQLDESRVDIDDFEVDIAHYLLHVM